MIRRDFWRNFDFWLLGIVIILCIFGVVMIRSAIAGNVELASYVNRQILFVGIGLVVLMATAILDYHYWSSFSRILYFTLMGLLIIIFVGGGGESRFGASRWFDVGSFLIQPAELAKIVMVIVLANFFAQHRDDPKNLIWVGRSAILTGAMAVWIYLQPNLSNTIVVGVLWLSMLWVAGLPLKYIAIFGVVAIIVVIVAFPSLEIYQQERVLTFFFPESEARHGNSYNIEQALVSIGSGGLLGQGYGHATQVQLRFLKVRHTDFIFSATAAEFGFVGTVVVMALLAFVIYRCFAIARRSTDPFGSFLAYGFAILISFQTAVNIGVNLNILPVTGLTLPFISYGGSSLLSMAMGIGLVESVAARQKPVET